MISNKNIDGGNAFDWGKASKDYAKYRDIYPDEFYKKIYDLGLCTSGQTVLDLGTGTGVLPRNMYHFGAKFVGADISENQIAEAKRLSLAARMNIEYVVASAETVDFPPSSFDVITACQCFIYFDKAIALPKIHDMLKDSGRFCVLWVAWLPNEDEIANGSEQLVLKYNPTWTGAGYIRPEMTVPKWSEPLFLLEHAASYDIRIPFTRESWHGRMLACRGIGASSLSKEEITAFEEEHRNFLKGYPEQFNILHHVTILDLRKRILE